MISIIAIFIFVFFCVSIVNKLITKDSFQEVPNTKIYVIIDIIVNVFIATCITYALIAEL